jgi:hypothetical protein
MMARKKPGTNANGEVVLFDVIYEDGTQLSNRRLQRQSSAGSTATSRRSTPSRPRTARSDSSPAGAAAR